MTSDLKNPEIQEIRKAVQVYLDGIAQCNYDKISQVFHPKAQIFALSQEKLRILPATAWKDYCEKTDPSNQKFSAEIVSIDNVGTAAAVKVLINVEGPNGIFDFTDFYNLLKLDNKWKVMNKTFHSDIKMAKT
ncbi:MAG: nuclear transport factor 2 family protein [Candidatus Hodarchaeota archaeon]